MDGTGSHSVTWLGSVLFSSHGRMSLNTVGLIICWTWEESAWQERFYWPYRQNFIVGASCRLAHGGSVYGETPNGKAGFHRFPHSPTWNDAFSSISSKDLVPITARQKGNAMETQNWVRLHHPIYQHPVCMFRDDTTPIRHIVYYWISDIALPYIWGYRDRVTGTHSLVTLNRMHNISLQLDSHCRESVIAEALMQTMIHGWWSSNPYHSRT